MDKELKNIWQEHIDDSKLGDLQNAISELRDVKTPADLKPKLLAISEQESKVFDFFKVKLIATAASFCLVLAIVLGYQSTPSGVQQQASTQISEEELLEDLDYIFDDSNFDLFVFNSDYENLGESLL